MAGGGFWNLACARARVCVCVCHDLTKLVFDMKGGENEKKRPERSLFSLVSPDVCERVCFFPSIEFSPQIDYAPIAARRRKEVNRVGAGLGFY